MKTLQSAALLLAFLQCARMLPQSAGSFGWRARASPRHANPSALSGGGLENDLRSSVWDIRTLETRFRDLDIPLKHLRSLYSFALRQAAETRLLSFDASALPQSNAGGKRVDEMALQWEDVGDLPKRAVHLLNREFTTTSSRLLSVRHSPPKLLRKQGAEDEASKSGQDTASSTAESARESANAKLGIQLRSGRTVETVLIGHGSHSVTVCVSCQVGCAKGCAFCETGTMGLRQNLEAHEILEQLFHAKRFANSVASGLNITNVVFMGMGEPLDNIDAVKSSVSVMTEYWRIAPRRITVSTVGDRPEAIKALAGSGVQLALSLHAPNEEIRQQIVPTAKSTSMSAIMEAVEDFLDKSNAGKKRSMVMVEYVVIKGVNDQTHHAADLAKLLDGKPVWCNLIPYNPTNAGDRYGFEVPDTTQISLFAQQLRRGVGADGKPLKVRVRWSTQAAQPIGGACGQLAVKIAKTE